MMLKPIKVIKFVDKNWKNIKSNLYLVDNQLILLKSFEDYLSILIYNNLLLYPYIEISDDNTSIELKVFNENDENYNDFINFNYIEYIQDYIINGLNKLLSVSINFEYNFYNIIEQIKKIKVTALKNACRKKLKDMSNNKLDIKTIDNIDVNKYQNILKPYTKINTKMLQYNSKNFNDVNIFSSDYFIQQKITKASNNYITGLYYIIVPNKYKNDEFLKDVSNVLNLEVSYFGDKSYYGSSKDNNIGSLFGDNNSIIISNGILQYTNGINNEKQYCEWIDYINKKIQYILNKNYNKTNYLNISDKKWNKYIEYWNKVKGSAKVIIILHGNIQYYQMIYDNNIKSFKLLLGNDESY